MKGYERLAQAFAAEGVTKVFGMMGSATEHWCNELDKLGVQVLEVRHEGFGLGMADGWARATRTVGVATATSGPGVTQLATALVTAARASSPIVAFVGEVNATEPDAGQFFDHARFAAACECGFVRVNTAAECDEAVRKAFYLAKLESRPIMLSAPRSAQNGTFDDDDPYVTSAEFYRPQRVLPADPAELQAVADLIAASSKPVIVAGRGAQWSGAGPAILKLAERIGALVTTSLQAKNWLNHDEFHAGITGLYATRTAMELLADADCVIGVGASLNRYTLAQGYLYSEHTRFIHIDSKPHVVMGGGRIAAHYVQADARAAVEALEALLQQRGVKMAGYRTPPVKEKLKSNYIDRMEFPIEPGVMDPREACTVLDEVIPETMGIGTSSGACGGFTNMHFTRARPLLMGSHFFACIGQMVSAAMGAVVATGNKPMMVVDGDASTMMHLNDFDTAVRYNLPLLIVVLNDQAMGAEFHHMNAGKMNAGLALVPTPDLGAVATAMGGRGALVTDAKALRQAASGWVANPGPMIIDCRISRNVLPIHVRRIHYAMDA